MSNIAGAGAVARAAPADEGGAEVGQGRQCDERALDIGVVARRRLPI
jgi:hypothetical protein